MKRLPSDTAASRILAEIMDVRPVEEPVHDKDCPACDLACEVTGTVMAYWDPNDTWVEVEAPDGLPGDTLSRQLERMVAHVLHRRLPGHGRPTRRGGAS